MNPMEFTIPEEDKLPFTEYYKKYIAPKCQSYELERISAVAKQTKRRKVSQPLTYLGMAIFFASFAFCFYALAILDDGGLFFTGLVAAIFAMVCVAIINIWANGEASKLRDNIFNDIYPIVIGYFGKSFELNPSNLPELDTYKSYGILPDYDRSHFDDSFKGTYKDVPFVLREVVLEESDGYKDDKKKYKTIFDGIFVEFSIPKRFSGTTVISQDKGFFANRLTGFMSKLSRVKLEDVAFEKHFEVYSSDQVEARYLLNTAAMERFLSLAQFYRAGLEASFNDQKLLIKLSSKHNYFEPQLDISKPLSFRGDIEQLFKELTEIFSFIDALNLDAKTGL
ncbi:DUF3137 domain-containing protein [Shewanella woodyi]|uniref:DUF3137 domain-containing protein n=1 Tax=Shewanella woodyi TaxID=60961 RepID=UPI00374A849F